MTTNPLLSLLVVQDLDTEADQLRHKREHLPERSLLAEVDREALQIRPQLEEARRVAAEIAARQAATEEELAATEHRAAAVSKRLYGGEVSASRELQAMAADLESLKARASALEDAGIEILEEREPADSKVAEIEARLASLGHRRRATLAELAESEAVVDREASELERRRASAAEDVLSDLLDTYERIRKELGGVGAARLVGSRCDGCHLTLPATELDRIRHIPADELVTCDHCGRILVRT